MLTPQNMTCCLTPPLMNAAGSLGFAPDMRTPVDMSKLGAFITNPISLGPRSPAQGKRFPGVSGRLSAAYRLSQPRLTGGYSPVRQALGAGSGSGDCPPAGGEA